METVIIKQNLSRDYIDGNTLSYSSEIAGVPIAFIYLFNENDQLYEIDNISLADHTNMQEYINDYMQLKSTLISVFGKVTSDSIEKTDKRADALDDLTALVSGYVTYIATWDRNDGNITLIMISKDSTIHTGILFKANSVSGPEA